MRLFSSGNKRWRPTKIDTRVQPDTSWKRFKKWMSDKWTRFLTWIGWRKSPNVFSETTVKSPTVKSPIVKKFPDFLTPSNDWDVEKILARTHDNQSKNKTQFISTIPLYERKNLVTALEMAQAPLEPIENLNNARLKKLLVDFIFLNSWIMSHQATVEDKEKQKSLQAYLVSEYIYFAWAFEYPTDDPEKRTWLTELFKLAEYKSDTYSVSLMAEDFLIKVIAEIKTSKSTAFLMRWERFCRSSVYQKLTLEFQEDARIKIQEARHDAAQSAAVQLLFAEGRFDEVMQHLPKESDDLIKTLILSLKNAVIAEIENHADSDVQFKKLHGFFVSSLFNVVLSTTDQNNFQDFYENIQSAKKITRQFIQLFEMIVSDTPINDLFLKNIENKQLIWAGKEASKQAFLSALHQFTQLDTTSLLQKGLTELMSNKIKDMTLVRVFCEKKQASLLSEEFSQRIRASISFSAEKAKKYVREKLMGDAFPFRAHNSVAWAFDNGAVQEKTEAQISVQLANARNALGREKGEYLGETKEWVNVNCFKYHYALAFQIELNRFIARTDYGARDGTTLHQLQRLCEFLNGIHIKIGKHAEADGTFDKLTLNALAILHDIIEEWKTGKAPEKRPDTPASNQSFFSRASRSRSNSPAARNNRVTG